MTYNEWRDELKSNLLSVSESERKRVLDYYAEAYADRREAGYSEREIIDDFGAPYDAAQRILNESIDEEANKGEPEKDAPPPRRDEKRDPLYGQVQKQNTVDAPPSPPPKTNLRRENGALFVVLCIVLCIPLFGLIMALAGITFGLIVAPFALAVTGGAAAIGAIVAMAGGDIAYGFYLLGGGLIEIGVGIALIPLLYRLVKLIWSTFNRVINAIRNALTGREKTV